jgi:hypothetical protein
MMNLHKQDFINLCHKYGKTLDDCFASVVDTSDNIWVIDENHELFPKDEQVTPLVPEEPSVYNHDGEAAYPFLKK